MGLRLKYLFHSRQCFCANFCKIGPAAVNCLHSNCRQNPLRHRTRARDLKEMMSGFSYDFFTNFVFGSSIFRELSC